MEKNRQLKSYDPIFKLVGSFRDCVICEMAESSKNTAFVTEFIDIYRKLPCLWKVKSKSYSNRHEKNKAYEKLLLFYKQTDPNATIDSVKKKINNLRCTFRKELKKLRKSKRSGEGSDNVHVPTLWYFNLLMFTADQEEPRTSISNDTQSDEETEIECEFQNDPDETESDNNDMEDNSHVSLDAVPETPIVIDRPYRTPSRSSASQPPYRTPSRTSTALPIDQA
ncbi:hypothetical protein JTB14_012001 [Gonioctena quinquepunctata]|nr:hypothetical protein JTB14_012001 [Gonioctena quinquepunctata]